VCLVGIKFFFSEPSNSAVFGVPLQTLLERDCRLPGCEDLKIPYIIQKVDIPAYEEVKRLMF